ncbi:hypothetical protein ACFW04_009346 [Cataglyphis niger]
MSNSTIRYSLADVGKCDGKNGARTWIVIYDNIYDVTDYITQHPGGTELIEEYAGKDATNGFDDFGHSSDAKKILKEYLIGELEENKEGKPIIISAILMSHASIAYRVHRPMTSKLCRIFNS